MKEILREYKAKEKEIKQRLKEFSSLRKASTEDIFYELCFCIMAVQTSGLRSWKVVEKLKEQDFFNKGTNPKNFLRQGYVRFHNNKTRHLLEAREKFAEIISVLREEKNVDLLREWLVKNVKGVGYKEASHFLRNIGMTQELAIIDRHILRNMLRYRTISEIPKSISRKKYLELEQKFQNFSKRLELTPAALDLFFWAKETGVVFK